MSRPLINTSAELQKNFKTFLRLRESRKQEDVNQYRAYMKSAKVLVVEKMDGKREYAPSRFVGYKNNSVAVHESDPFRDGGVTTIQLEKIYDKWVFDPIETERYKRYLAKHGVEKDFARLNTPPKFIFASYSPSADATRNKPGSSKEVDTDEDSADTDDLNAEVPPMPLNQILYGPPGTGKTYHTVTRAVALLEGISDEEVSTLYPERTELRQKFEEYRKAQRVEFVTFHQAFSYEDFIEGIKPLPPGKDEENDLATTSEAKPVQYDVVPGVFRRICESANAASNTATAPPVPDFDILYDGFVEQLDQRMKSTRGSLTFYSKTGEPLTLTNVNLSLPTKRLTFLHANSAQQDHHIDKPWIKKVYDKYTSVDQIKHITKDITKTIGGSNASLMWAVFNELKKHEASWIAQEREKRKTTPAPPFVLIIDEINRGNIANIFGELITLLEDDKRAGNAEALALTLPYSKEQFSVPPNLYLLGTMNTADRSVEALDTALRRRFSFTEMLSRPELLSTDVEGVNVQEMLIAINSRLEQLLDHDHCIGHALLMRVTRLDGLREAFRRNILPLLQEYFFGDWGKIGLVLGNAFIQQVNKNQNTTGYKLLPFGSYSTGELSEKPVYKLTDVQKLSLQAFQGIYA